MKLTLNLNKILSKHNKLAIAVAFVFIFILTNKGLSQSCANYAPVTRTTSITYTSIAGSSPNYFTWRNNTGNQNDDNRAFPVSIGFDFWYLGVRYTQFSGNLNGFIDFSTSTNDGNNQSEYGPGHGNQFTIGGVGTGSLLTVAPLYDDLWTAGSGTTAIATSCFYNTTGTAPNRVTTIEWLNFDEFNSSTGSLNFQIKLYETTGVIEFIYGTMTQGSIAATYATGINNTWPTGAPTASQLLTQQTVNTTTFSNTAQNALVTLPTSNSMLTFTPPTPDAAPTGLSFSAITGSSMTLNWTNSATNEIGYVIYNSIDGGTTYDFVSQTAANAVSSNVTGLSPSTTYDWKIITVTDGGISTGLTGTQATLAPTSITSIASSSWNTPTTWDCTCVPSSGDVVTIADAHIVTLDVNGSCFDLTIGVGTSGQLIVGNDATGRSLTVNGNLVVNAGATFTTGATNATHTLTLKKDFTNNGTVQLAPTASRICNVTFNRNGNQTLSGTGATTNLNLVTLNMGTSTSNIFEVTATNFSAATNFLTLTNGTFKVSTAATLTLASANTTITSNARIWSNHAAAILNYNTGNVILLGSLRSTLGTINIGTVSNNLLTINGGSVVVDGGTINVASSLDNQGISALVSVTISSGTLLVNRFGLTTAGLAPFGIDESGSTFNMSGGSIIIQNPGAGNLGYTNTGATLGTISGGTIQIGNASTTASQTFLINSSKTIPNLTIGGGVATTAQLATNNIPVLGDLLINTGSTFNLSTFTANRSSAGGILTVAGSMLLGNNTGGQTGSNFPTNYSSLVLTGGIVNYNRAAGGQTIFATPTYTTLTMGNTSGTQTAGGNITTTTLNNNTAGIILDMATFTLAATTITNNATATIRTQNTSATPIPTGITIGGIVNYNAATGAQTIRGNTYTTLTMGNTSGTQTAAGNIITTTLNNNSAGIILDMATFTLAATTITNNATATIRTQNTSATPIPTGITIGGIVNYNAATGAQTIRANTYTTLTMGNTSGTQTAAGNITTTTLNNNTNAADILNMVTFTLAATTVNNTGTIRTQSTSATPLPTAITIAGTVTYDNLTGGQTIRPNTYTNLTMGNTSGTQTATANLASTGTFTTTAGGTLNMVTFTLTVATVAHNGILNTQRAATPVTTGKTWGGTVNYNTAAGGQTIMAGTYGILTLGNTSGTQTASGNIIATTVNNNTNAADILNMVTFSLAATTVNNTGTIRTQNTSATPLPASITYGGTVQYDGVAQTVVNASYNNLSLAGSLAKTLNAGMTSIGGNLTMSGTATATLVANLSIAGDLSIGTGTTLTFSTFTANRSSAGGILTVAGSMLLGNNTGGQTGSNFPTNYSSLVLTGGTVNYNRAAGGQTIFATPTYTTLTMGNTSGTQTADGNITTTTLNNNTAGILLDMATFTLSATTITNNATATIRSQNTSATPIPTGLTIGGIVNYNAAAGAQTIRGNTYTTLTMGNTSGTQTAAGNIITTTLNNNTAGIILDMASFTLAATTITNNATATIQTQNTSATPLPTGITIGGIVNYNAATGAQTIRANTYTTLTMGNTSGTQTAAGNITTTTLNNNTNAADILNMVTFTLAATTVNNTGTIRTQSTSATPLPTAIIIAGTVTYDNLTGGQTIRPNTYTNLTMGNTSGTQTATANLASTGTFTTTAGGTLNMVTFTLTVATVSHSGILNTQNISATPVTTAKTWGGTVNYNSASAQTIVNGNYTNLDGTGGARTLSNTGTVGVSGTFTLGVGAYTVTSSTVDYNNLTGGQTIANLSYNNLTLGNTSGTQTSAANLVVNGTLTTTAGGILDLGATNTLSGTLATVANNGTIATQSTTAALPTGKTWGGTVNYNRINGGQSVVSAVSYNNLTLSNTSNTQTSAANLVVDGTLTTTTGGTLALGTNTLSGTLATIANNGTISTTNTSATPIPSGKTWGGKVFYFATTGSQTLVSGVYNTLEMRNTSGTNTLSGDMTVNTDFNFTTGGKVLLSSFILTLNGTLTDHSATSTFASDGTASIVIGGSGALGSNLFLDQTTPGTSNRLTDLTYNRSSQTITLGNAMQITGTVTPTAGTLATGGFLTLVSDATNTARIADGGCTTCSYITGNVHVQRNIPATARRWRFMGSPVTTSTLADWQAETYITGTGGAANGFDATLSNQASVFSYNESITTGDLNTGWVAASNTTNTLDVGKGYRLFIRGDRSDAGRLTGTVTTQNEVTLDLVGEPNQGDIVMPVTFNSSGTLANDGWNLVSNPYASPYDWDAHYDDGSFHTNIDPTIQILSAITGAYDSYTATGNTGSLTGGIIPPGASFWVKANAGSPSLTFKEQFKVGTTPVGVFKTNENESFSIQLYLDSNTSDKVFVKYMGAATANYDNYDIIKLGAAVSISAYGNDNVMLAASVRPVVNNAVDTVKLKVTAAAGNYKLKFANSNQIAVQENVFLIDSYLSTVTDLKVTNEYPFSIVTGVSATQGLNRFYIVVANNTSLPVKLLTFGARATAEKTVALNWATAQETNNDRFVVERSSNGINYETIGEVKGNGNTSTLINYTFADKQPSSVNYYRLKQVDYDGTATYSAVRNVNFGQPNLGLTMYPIPAKEVLTISHMSLITSLHIYDVTGKEVYTANKLNSTATIEVEQLVQGIYFVELTDETGTTYKDKFVKE